MYRKYRSKTLDEVVGQQHITDILSRALAKGKISHAYLFTGPRGVGKTSVARILAHEINKLPYDEAAINPDIIEIDAASNRRIDDIRDLREKVQIAPTNAKYKIYIIDEVHMLTGESFNAFLKTLEEPPEHVIFILATTDAHKLPTTITSRTQQFRFRAISTSDAQTHLRAIAKAEKIRIDDDALRLIAQHGDGSFRDSIGLLDQLSSLAEDSQTINRELVERVLGLTPAEQIEELLIAYESGDHAAIITLLEQLEQGGASATMTANQLLDAVRLRLADSPALTPLLGALMGVAGATRPDIALLVALLPPVTVVPTKVRAAVATVAAPRELKTLETEAQQPHPNETHVRKKVAKEPTATSEKPVESTAPEINTAETEESTPSNAVIAQTSDFDWAAYATSVKDSNVAIASILNKCKGEVVDQTLTIYTGTAFWKKKLDESKYQPILHDTLRAQGYGDLTIETVPTTMPPKDSQAAAVAAIMGGGEEVSLD